MAVRIIEGLTWALAACRFAEKPQGECGNCKGPAPGWGWPSLGGLPTPAPLQEPEGYRQCRPGPGTKQCSHGGL